MTHAPHDEQQKVRIRPGRDSDRPAILVIARELVTAADTYAFDTDVSDEELWAYWMPAKGGQGFVAELDGAVAGMFVIKRNHPGPAAHIANASYAVCANQRGRGIGGLMGRASLNLARDMGFKAMQFNIVLANNLAAVRAWTSLGFRMMGTIPEGFRSPDGSYQDFHIMHRSL